MHRGKYMSPKVAQEKRKRTSTPCQPGTMETLDDHPRTLDKHGRRSATRLYSIQRQKRKMGMRKKDPTEQNTLWRGKKSIKGGDVARQEKERARARGRKIAWEGVRQDLSIEENTTT